jgi:hypothetical protein
MSTFNIIFWASIIIFFGNLEALLEVGLISSFIYGFFYITPELLSENLINYFYRFKEYFRQLLRRLFIAILETPDNTTSPTTSPNKYEIDKTIAIASQKEENIDEKKGLRSYWKYLALATIIIITIGGVVIYLYPDILFKKGDQGGGGSSNIQQNITNSEPLAAEIKDCAATENRRGKLRVSSNETVSNWRNDMDVNTYVTNSKQFLVNKIREKFSILYPDASEREIENVTDIQLQIFDRQIAEKGLASGSEAADREKRTLTNYGGETWENSIALEDMDNNSSSSNLVATQAVEKTEKSKLFSFLKKGFLNFNIPDAIDYPIPAPDSLNNEPFSDTELPNIINSMNVPDKLTVDQIKTPETYYSKNNDFYGSDSSRSSSPA